ncbi:hypothetical protein ABPG72_006480 [Tetrahymena utriculariae]
MGNCHQNSIIPGIFQHDQIKIENYSQFSSFRKQISLVINNSKGNIKSLIQELSQKMIQYQQITHYYISFESEDFINHIGNLDNAFKQSNQLIELSLNFQRLSIQNNGLKKIGQCLQHCQKLKRLELCLGSNQFTYEGIQSLCKTITKLKLLQRVFLELYVNQLESDSIIDLGEVVAQMPCLISLKLDFSQLHKFIYQSNQFKKNSFNNVQFDGIQQFVNSVNKSEQIQYLDLTLEQNSLKNIFSLNNFFKNSVNNILDIGSLAFKQIEQKIQLTQLSLSLWQISFNKSQQLSLNSIKHFSSNNISNVDQLIDSICQLYNLYYLVIDLSYNPIGALVDQLEIAKKFNNLKKLLVFKFKMRVTANHRIAKKYVKINFKKLITMQFNS